jgi:hypothetical protein
MGMHLFAPRCPVWAMIQAYRVDEVLPSANGYAQSMPLRANGYADAQTLFPSHAVTTRSLQAWYGPGVRFLRESDTRRVVPGCPARSPTRCPPRAEHRTPRITCEHPAGRACRSPENPPFLRCGFQGLLAEIHRGPKSKVSTARAFEPASGRDPGYPRWKVSAHFGKCAATNMRATYAPGR